MRELLLLHALSAHPNIVDVHGYTLNGNVAGMVLEYAPDRDLHTYLRREELSLSLQVDTAVMVRAARRDLELLFSQSLGLDCDSSNVPASTLRGTSRSCGA